MPRIKNHKPIIIVLVVLLLILSILVMLSPEMQPVRSVRIQNQNIVINQESTSISHTQLGMKNSAKIQNEDINSLNKNLHLDNSEVNIDNKFHDIHNGRIKYKNTDPFDDISLNKNSKINKSSFHFQNSSGYTREMQRYKYQNINWGSWKSRFVNRILDDSLYVKSLDNYGIGTWFYYSFVVTDTGEIHNVTVFSLYLTKEDCNKIRELIRSYEGMPITMFPKNSKRKRAKIKAIMLLGNSEQKANSSNFSDNERVKVRY